MNREPRYVGCPDCFARGWVEEDCPRPASFSNSYGYIDTVKVDCPRCEGDGFIDKGKEAEGEDE